MRELRIDGTLILAVDHGYGNIKTANTVFSNGFVERDTEPVMSTDYLYYSGKYYVLDQGHKNYTKDKVMDNDFYILTVAAIAKELYLRNVRCEKIHLAVGVPLKWMDSQKESFQAYMLQNSEIKQIGHEADFDRLYEESKRLVDVVKKNVVADKAEKVARELLACGPYKYLKTSVKADAFMFDVSDTGGNLKLFMSVLDKLGVKLDGDQLYEEYQKIYDDTVSGNEMHEREQEKQWNKGRGR